MAAGYTALFAALAFRWLRQAHESVPHELWMGDSLLIVRVLAWIAHALVVSPTRVFDIPMNFPAPAQLTGSEHFASSQLIFAPFFWATGNAVLAANAVALGSYPLAALAMQRLLVALGCATGAALVGGLLFALGPLRVPGSLHMIQYLNLWLPVVALGLLRLREQPTTGRALMLWALLTLGFFSSYYMAVMLCLTVTAWAAHELLRGAAHRRRFVALVLAAAAAALLLLVVASVPYLERSTIPGELEALAGKEELNAMRVEEGLWTGTMAPLVRGFAFTQPWLGPIPLLFMGLGMLALRPAGDRAGRRVAWLGLIFSAIGGILALGPAIRLGDHVLSLPYAGLAVSRLRFFRVPERFIVLGAFGTALLAGAGLDAVERAVRSPRLRALVVSAAALVVVWGEGLAVATSPLVTIRAASADASVYEEVGRRARQLGGGPLLEVPATDVGAAPSAIAAEAMIGSTRHRLPTVLDYTGYPPPHRRLVGQVVSRLPDGDALAELVDMTHLRWLLLRPATDWPRPGDREEFLARLEAHPGALGPRWSAGEFLLVGVDLTPRRPQWFRTLAAGPSEGRSLLGTPFVPPVAPVARARITAVDPPQRVDAHSILTLDLTISNLGESTWPVFIPPPDAAQRAFARAIHLSKGALVSPAPIPTAEPPPTAVQLVARWWPAARPREAPAATQPVPLGRDVAAGESLRQLTLLLAPDAPGLYELEIDGAQVDGSPFAGPGSSPLRLPVWVAPAAPR